MRNSNGQFVKGFHSSKKTEIKKGQHLSQNTEFQKGCIPKKPFQKGNIPWARGRKFSKKYREKLSKSHKGIQAREKHPNWKGGKYKNSAGYILILNPAHPFSNRQGYIFEHRLIIEDRIKRFIKKEEHCHHINKIKTDNRIKNLILFSTNSSHQRFHGNPNNVKPEEIIFDGRKII